MEKTSSYSLFKGRVQSIFDFAVLITLAVPELKKSISLKRKGTITKLSDPDYFHPSVTYQISEETLIQLKAAGVPDVSIENLQNIKDKPFPKNIFKEKVSSAIGKENFNTHRDKLYRQSECYLKEIHNSTKDYKKNLATYLYFSSFSYFEGYIFDLSNEVANWYLSVNLTDLKQGINQTGKGDAISARKILSGDFDKKKLDRYKKYSNKLVVDGYNTPEKILLTTMLNNIKETAASLKANDIPLHLKRVYLFEMTESEIESFNNIRANRNKLAHGEKGFSPSLNDVIKMNEFFKKLSSRIDEHIMLHFKKINNFYS